MLSHKKPTFSHNFKIEDEKKALRDHLKQPSRAIPKRTKQNLLVATWNLTNFGAQDRKPRHFELMAEVIKPFDVVAVQEVADDLTHLDKLLKALGTGWSAIFSDIAGNDERLGYLYRRSRVKPTGLAAELAMRGYERQKIVVEGIMEESGDFSGFNRNPYIVGFAADKFQFSLVNVHLYWSNIGVRQLESKALAKWAASRVSKPGPPNNDIILLGDFNMPRSEPGDPIYDQLAEKGMRVPKHTTNLIGTNLAGDYDYDQIAFFPSRTDEDFSNRMGVLDFDNALFRGLWKDGSSEDRKRFGQYVRYYMADHRPLWVEFLR